jgi:outer membrane receptor protein involved in Fe transport
MDASTRLVVKPYVRYHDMTFLQHFLPWQALEENGHRSLGAQVYLTRQQGEVTLSYGLDVDLTEGWLKETQAEFFSPTIPQGDHYDYDVVATTLSPFTEMNWQATDALLLSAGVRYEYMGYDYDNALSPGSACAPDVEGCRFSRPQDQQVSFRNFSGRLGASLQWREDHYVYSQLANGYRPPQATELFRLQAGQLVADLKSEKMTSLELGFRGEWRGHTQRLFYDVTLFTMDKSNHIFQDTERQVVSDGETRHDGLELSTQWQFSAAWTARLAGTFAEHRYVRNVNISRGVAIDGNEIDTAPETFGTLALQWQDGRHYGELEWLYMGPYYLDPANTAEYDGHQLLNIRAGVALNNQVNVGVRVMNALNEDYAERADFAFGAYRYFVGEPRSVYVSLGLEL